WLNIVKSTQAKNKINQWFKNELKEENILKGKEMMQDYCKAHSIDQAKVFRPEYIHAILEKYGFKDWDAVRAAVGHGGLKEGQIINKMMELYDKDHPRILSDDEVMESVNGKAGERKIQIKSKGGIVVRGIDDVAVRFSKCCNPIPGDEIVGFVTRGRGVSIHRTDCINIINLPEMERARLIEAEWQQDANKMSERYMAEINIYSVNRTGMLAEITRILTEKNVSILKMNVRTSKQGTATTSISFEVANKDELNNVIERLGSIEDVIDIERTTG
ncbi:MAG TPA: GTP pyrophosphokinase, partial [Lachnospiraceae bacterium]|nr:GTP pyrophosphokinase [Lachnospiraceae bacterium]